MGLLSALGKRGMAQLRSGAMFGDEAGGLLSRAQRALPDGGSARTGHWVDLYSGQRGDPNRPWRGHMWTTQNRGVASEYGPNVREMQGDISGAPTIRTEADLRQLVGPRADEVMAQRRGDVWQYLDDPAVRDALRERGVSAIHVPDDMRAIQPEGPGINWHESYLMLDENRIRNAPNTGSVL